jgi:hypothetical protein
MTCLAMVNGAQSEEAIAEWGESQGRRWLQHLGMRRHRGPSQATIQRIFKGIDRSQLETALNEWSETVLAATDSTGSLTRIGDRDQETGIFENGRSEEREENTFYRLNQWVEKMMSRFPLSDERGEERVNRSLFEGIVLSGFGDPNNQHISGSGLKIWAIDYESINSQKGIRGDHPLGIAEHKGSGAGRAADCTATDIQRPCETHIQKIEKEKTAA